MSTISSSRNGASECQNNQREQVRLDSEIIWYPDGIDLIVSHTFMDNIVNLICINCGKTMFSDFVTMSFRKLLQIHSCYDLRFCSEILTYHVLTLTLPSLELNDCLLLTIFIAFCFRYVILCNISNFSISGVIRILYFWIITENT